MSAEIVYGVFDNYGRAARAVSELRSQNLGQRAISVMGPDRNQILPVTAQLVDRSRMHPFVKSMIIAGAILGFITGLATFIMPKVAGMVISGPIMAAISAASAGAYVGLLAAAALTFENPVWAGDVYENPDMQTGTVVVAVKTDDAHHIKYQHLFENWGAVEVDRRLAA